jgi:diguanylate cyclase (GGDEF)-like protein
MGKELRIVMVEDLESDAKLVERELKRAGLTVQMRRVENEEDFRRELGEFQPDVILSDFTMPQFDGMSALRIARETVPEVPFIFVSGTLGEDYAIRALRNSATDYVLKNNLVRLPPAIERAVSEAAARAERKREERLLALEHTVVRHIADADNVSDGLKAVMRSICKTEDWECGRYFSVDGKAGLLRFAEGWSVPGEAIERFIAGSRTVTYAPGAGLAGLAWQSGQPVWSSDIANDPRVAQLKLARDTDMHGAFVFPVMFEGEVVGVFAFNSRQVREPESRLLQAIHVIGSQIGQFLTRQEQQRHIARLYRIYAMLSGINSTIVRVHSRDELFREACRIAVEAGSFPLAWLGVVDQKEMRVTPVAWHGSQEGVLGAIAPRLLVADGTPGARGLVGQAVRERKPSISNDADNDSRIVAKEAHRKAGIRSLAVLPLVVSGQTVAVLALHAEVPGFFDDEEMKLLLELAGDISFALDHIEKEEKLNYLAYYDSLTGLANRSLFYERLVQYVSTAQNERSRLAVAVVDIDRFKIINDSLGRQAGDELLKQIAERVKSHVGPIRMARISADRFAIARSGVSSESEVARLVEQWLAECFGPPYVVSGTELRVSAKAGIALFPNDGADADALFQNAEAALKKAKATGERYLFHTQEMTERIGEKLALENKLRQALEKEEFVLHYQPKVDTATRRIDSVEALIRWQSPELGLVPPMQFIPLLEETGLILEVGAWALRRAVVDHRTWTERGLFAPRVSVNVSAVQLRKRDFVATVEKAIKLGSVPPGIDLEITESLVMEDIGANVQKLEALRLLGLSIAVDDFGTGYSSLGYLAKLPVQTLKIDRSFIITMLKDSHTMTLVSTIISLAHSLNLKVVAEGVDAEEQAKVLKRLGCDQMQGYLFSKPIPGDQLEKLLARESRPLSRKAGTRRRQKT